MGAGANSGRGARSTSHSCGAPMEPTVAMARQDLPPQMFFVLAKKESFYPLCVCVARLPHCYAVTWHDFILIVTVPPSLAS